MEAQACYISNRHPSPFRTPSTNCECVLHLVAKNPAEVNLNVIEGVYPSKPEALSFPGLQRRLSWGGNEGLAEVTSVDSGVKSLERGDWVSMRATQVGIWRSAANLLEGKVPMLKGLSEVNAATMMVRVILFAFN